MSEIKIQIKEAVRGKIDDPTTFKDVETLSMPAPMIVRGAESFVATWAYDGVNDKTLREMVQKFDHFVPTKTELLWSMPRVWKVGNERPAFLKGTTMTDKGVVVEWTYIEHATAD